MNRNRSLAVAGGILIAVSALYTGFHFSYGGFSLPKFALAVGFLYLCIGFGADLYPESPVAIWLGTTVALVLLNGFLVHSQFVLGIGTRPDPPGLIQITLDQIPHSLAYSAVGAGPVAGIQHHRDKSATIAIILGVVLFLVATAFTAATMASLTFFPILQFLVALGILVAATPPYFYLRNRSA